MSCYAEPLDALQILGGERHCQDLDEDKVHCVVPIDRVFQTSQEYIQSLGETVDHSEKPINALKDCVVSLVRL